MTKTLQPHKKKIIREKPDKLWTFKATQEGFLIKRKGHQSQGKENFRILTHTPAIFKVDLFCNLASQPSTRLLR